VPKSRTQKVVEEHRLEKKSTKYWLRCAELGVGDTYRMYHSSNNPDQAVLVGTQQHSSLAEEHTNRGMQHNMKYRSVNTDNGDYGGHIPAEEC